MRVAIYARVSTIDQDYSMQVTECMEYARRNDWDTTEYVEKVSTRKRRPVLDQLMNDARLKKFDIVLVWKLDRFGRSVRDLTENIMQLDRYGVRFVCLTQGIDTDKRNPAARLLLHIMAAFAEFERDIITDRVHAGMKQYRDDFDAGKIGTTKHSKSGKDLAPHRPVKVWDRQQARDMRVAGRSWNEICAATGQAKTAIRRALGVTK